MLYIKGYNFGQFNFMAKILVLGGLLFTLINDLAIKDLSINLVKNSIETSLFPLSVPKNSSRMQKISEKNKNLSFFVFQNQIRISL